MLVGLLQRELAGHLDLGLGTKLMADPADPHLVNGHHTRSRGKDALHLLHQLGGHHVHEPVVDVASG